MNSSIVLVIITMMNIQSLMMPSYYNYLKKLFSQSSRKCNYLRVKLDQLTKLIIFVIYQCLQPESQIGFGLPICDPNESHQMGESEANHERIARGAHKPGLQGELADLTCTNQGKTTVSVRIYPKSSQRGNRVG